MSKDEEILNKILTISKQNLFLNKIWTNQMQQYIKRWYKMNNLSLCQKHKFILACYYACINA